MSDHNETIATLKAARKLIERPDSWCQGTFLSNDGRRCASGALVDVGASLCDTSYTALGFACGNSIVCEWNDAPKRTHAEVLAAFDRAIELEEAK